MNVRSVIIAILILTIGTRAAHAQTLLGPFAGANSCRYTERGVPLIGPMIGVRLQMSASGGDWCFRPGVAYVRRGYRNNVSDPMIEYVADQFSHCIDISLFCTGWLGHYEKIRPLLEVAPCFAVPFRSTTLLRYDVSGQDSTVTGSGSGGSPAVGLYIGTGIAVPNTHGEFDVELGYQFNILQFSSQIGSILKYDLYFVTVAYLFALKPGD